ncbi:MAG: hypothetical protein ACE5J4_00780 [Candidatus Aenigmatarchaeota archaeon]
MRRLGGSMFRRLSLKRPVVIRKGNRVQTCYYYKDLKRCLGSRCFWQKVGVCPIYNRLKLRAK